MAMTPPNFRLDGSVAIVTGGAGALGSFAACVLAEAGAKIVLADIVDEQTVLNGRLGDGHHVLSTHCDVANTTSVDHMVDIVLDAFGRIDVLLNNAGIISANPLVNVGEDEWDKVMDVNLRGTWLCSRAIGRIMIEAGHGKIINMSSITASRGIQNRGAYCASKAAVTSLTRTMAIEFGPYNVNVNAIAPTAVVTNLNRELMLRQPHIYEAVLERTPLGRLARPEDLAGTLVFLASQASDYLTGQIIHVDGGFSAT